MEQRAVHRAPRVTDVGCDLGSPVTPDYAAGDNAFTGNVHWVQIDAGLDNVDHIVSASERLQAAMARQ